MKNIGIIVALLFIGFSVSAQHPLSKKGPKAKNYKASKDSNRKATKLSLFVAPSDKYATGANAKNTLISTESSEQITTYPKQGLKRGKGANAKNRYVAANRAKTVRVDSNEIKTTREELDLSSPKTEFQK